MKKVFLFLIIIFWHLSVSAQNNDAFSLYNYDLKLVNPSFTGIQGSQKLGLNFNFLNTRIEGLISNSVLLSYENKISGLNSGFGVIVNREIQDTRLTRWQWALLYNYQLTISDHRLSFGTSIDYRRQRFELEDLLTSRFGNFNNGVDVDDSESDVNVAFGIGYQFKNLTAGISLRNVFAPDPDLDRDFPFFPVRRKNLNLFVQYEYSLNKIKIIPSVLLLTNFGELNVDVNTIVEWNDLVLLGAGIKAFRGGKQAAFSAGINWRDKFKLVAAYVDLPNLTLGGFFPGNEFEFFLSTTLGKD